MNALRLSLLASALLAVTVPTTEAADSPARAVAPTASRPALSTKQQIKPAASVARRCRDLAAHAINFRIVSRTTQFRGTVEIGGAVRNVGGTAYESRPGQQGVQLYEGNRLVAQQAFQNLAPGQEVRVRYSRAWDASSASEGEFPPTYRLLVSYDPDITLDGNTNNDDCNHANDRLERSGSAINALFRP